MFKALEGYQRNAHNMNGPDPRLRPVALVCPYRRSAPSRTLKLHSLVIVRKLARAPFV